jgi:serine/threonine protein kinase
MAAPLTRSEFLRQFEEELKTDEDLGVLSVLSSPHFARPRTPAVQQSTVLWLPPTPGSPILTLPELPQNVIEEERNRAIANFQQEQLPLIVQTRRQLVAQRQRQEQELQTQTEGRRKQRIIRNLPLVPIWTDLWTPEATELQILTKRSEIGHEIKELGRGTFSRVVLVRDPNDPKVTHAVKIQQNDQKTTEIEASTIRDMISLNLFNHPNIVHLQAILLGPVRTYMVLENIDFSLSSFLDNMPSYEERKQIYYQLLNALTECHSKNIIHRDIKPANILLKQIHGVPGLNWWVKLTDFGICKPGYLPKPQDVEGSEYYTLWFRPPEVLLKDPNYGLAADMFAMGSTFYHLVRNYDGRLTGSDDTKADQETKDTAWHFNIKTEIVDQLAREIAFSIGELPAETMDDLNELKRRYPTQTDLINRCMGLSGKYVAQFRARAGRWSREENEMKLISWMMRLDDEQRPDAGKIVSNELFRDVAESEGMKRLYRLAPAPGQILTCIPYLKQREIIERAYFVGPVNAFVAENWTALFLEIVNSALQYKQNLQFEEWNFLNISLTASTLWRLCLQFFNRTSLPFSLVEFLEYGWAIWSLVVPYLEDGLSNDSQALLNKIRPLEPDVFNTNKHAADLQRFVLDELKLRMDWVTSLHFVHELLNEIRSEQREFVKAFCLVISLKFYKFIQYLPSTLAFAAIHLVEKALDVEWQMCTDEIQHLGLQQELLKETLTLIRENGTMWLDVLQSKISKTEFLDLIDLLSRYIFQSSVVARP